MKFTSTRKTESVSGGEAVLNGTPAGGGLYVPFELPVFSENEIAEFCKMTYPERVAVVFKKFFDDFSYYELLDYAEKAYASFEDVCPVVKLEDESYVAEIWHGPTATCKDLSLAMMPYVIEAAKKKLGLTKKTLAVFATTGNTGKAALESFTGHSGAKLVVVYPDAVMDYLQKLQLVTHVGDNTHVFGVKGSFSEAKESVSAFFSNKENKIALSASGYEAVDVSSVNWCRITAEIAFFGGSFTAIPRDYMLELLKAAKSAAERYSCYTGIRCSTRPDCIDEQTLALLKEYGMTAIELGA